MFEIKDVLMSVTNFCLGTCKYCNLKSLNDFSIKQEYDIKDAERFLSDKYLNKMENIHITGGEPILTPKTYEIFKLLNFYHPNIRVNMPVSGFFPETTYRYCIKLIQLMPNLRVDISIDGPKPIHEENRGENTWDNVNKTIDLLKKIQGLKIQLQLTVNKDNYKYINYIQDMADANGLGFFISFPHMGRRFGHKQDKILPLDENIINDIEDQIKDRWCLIRPLNKQVWLCQKATWLGKHLDYDCYMGKYSIDIDPMGNVYPCMVYLQNQIFGNIKEKTLTEMLESENAKKIMKSIQLKNCQPCIMPCRQWKKNVKIDNKEVIVGAFLD